MMVNEQNERINKMITFKIPLQILFLLTFSFTNFAQTDKPHQDWQQISRCYFSFSAPRTLKDLRSNGIDSCVSQFEDKNIRILIDVGHIRSQFEKDDYLSKLNGEILEIDGHKGKFSTYIDTDKDLKKRGNRKYVAGIYFESTDAQSKKIYFNITISGKTEQDLETSKQIFKTIKFQKNPIIRPVEIHE